MIQKSSYLELFFCFVALVLINNLANDRSKKTQIDMSKNVVLSYDEFILEKKINQELSSGTPESGTNVSKSVDTEAADLNVPSGSKSTKTVETKMATMPESKGSTPRTSVKPGTTTLPIKKGSAPSKMVSTEISDNLNVSGSNSGKTVDPKMADLPIGQVVPNPAVKKASPYKK